MLQRSGFPQPMAPEIASALNPTFTRPIQNGWRRLMLPLAWLPETWPQYLVLLAIVLVFAAGLAVQIYLTVEIARAQVELRALQAEYERVERHNADLVFGISTKTALGRIYAEAEQQGFVPATGREYYWRDQQVQTSMPIQDAAAPGSGLDFVAASEGAPAGHSPNAGPIDQAESMSAPAAGSAAGWWEQLAGALRTSGESFDLWRRGAAGSAQASAERWLDRIVGR
jgi:hypothetical protein